MDQSSESITPAHTKLFKPNSYFGFIPRGRILNLLIADIFGMLVLYGISHSYLLGSAIFLACLSTLYLIFRWGFDLSHTQYLILSVFPNAKRWSVLSRVYPPYKWVDIYRATESLAPTFAYSKQILTEHPMDLNHLLRMPSGQAFDCPIKPSSMNARQIGYDQETFLPVDSFWLVADAQTLPGGAVIRIRLSPLSAFTVFEVACGDKNKAIHLIDSILKEANAHSIYRTHMISPVFNSKTRPKYHEEETVTWMDLTFQLEHEVTDQDIILDDSVQKIVERAIIDFHNRRETLMQYGLPGRRGILFYGPPGTGKTYTCKYIAHKLQDATTIVATGKALIHIQAVCDLAKTFQPSLVILEDIDLIFAERNINPDARLLGELLDELDGFQANDQIIFILTTNAIERVETAIKDRPGRISQCVYFGPPHAALRRKYLTNLLKPYDTQAVNTDQVVGETDGVSQAFLKEMIFRAVQIASEKDSQQREFLALTQQDLTTAFEEMADGSGRWGKNIIGFRVE